jgi:hypothetical protein
VPAHRRVELTTSDVIDDVPKVGAIIDIDIDPRGPRSATGVWPRGAAGRYASPSSETSDTTMVR